MARVARAAPVLALALAGCSLLFAPNRDYPEGGMDGGPDGGSRPDGGDAGVDGGADGCPGSQDIERVCDDGEDDDCNGLVDCADFACAASPACCAEDGMPISFVGAYNGGTWRVDGAPAFMPEAERVDFGTAPYPQALVLNQCLPLAFGVELTLSFEVDEGTSGDYAALRFSPVDARAGTEPYLSELTLRVRDDGVVRVERAGTVIAERDLDATTVPVRLTLRPGLDEAQQGSLIADVEAAGQPLVDSVPLLSFESLRGLPECETDGLFLVLEGQGTNVAVSSALRAEQLACQNPNQFNPDRTLGTLTDAFAADTGWRSGGLGEPSVAHFIIAPNTERVELWADAARIERADEFLRRVDFTIGATRLQPSWVPRLGSGASPELVGPSAREPSLAPVLNASDQLVNLYLLAYAERTAGGGAHDIVLGTVAGAGTDNVTVSDPTTVLTPADAGCGSLRDPALVLLDREPLPQDVLLFYTCEEQGIDDRIGAARLAYDEASTSYRVTEVRSDLLTDAIGPYAARGAFSPEAVRVGEGATTRLRLWFLTRAESGEVSMSTAIGELPDDARLPVLSPYPGNPTLRAADPLLGGDCSLGCAIEAVAASRTVGARWPRSYLLVLAHSRVTSTGLDHALVPILQPLPANE